MNFPKELRYTNQHEWFRDESGTGIVGITDYAQQALGDVVYVEMPEIGTIFSKGDAFGVVESVKAASDIFAPVSGEIIEINQALEEHPEYINQSPYGDGWIIKLKVSEPSDINALMDSQKYQEFVKLEEENH